MELAAPWVNLQFALLSKSCGLIPLSGYAPIVFVNRLSELFLRLSKETRTSGGVGRGVRSSHLPD
jgi:hypothetical protein